MSPSAIGAEIGVFGGSGFYALFDDVSEVTVDTPYGSPSSPVTIGEMQGRRVAFIARHGGQHHLLPSQIPARANVWAMRMLGVTRIIGPCAAGSLTPRIHPGDFVALDQLVDRSWGRPDTYYDRGLVHHVSFADPYCPDLRVIACGAADRCGITMHDRGTVVVIPGPRFATRAESRAFRREGFDVINMTQYPEAFLARELGICYCGIALVTDYDTGVDDDPTVAPVSQDEVFAFFEANVARVRNLIDAMVPAIGVDRVCQCAASGGPSPV